MSEQFISNSALPYPLELDALTTAPKHHRLLMENEFVRVIDACIPPGETTPVHTHCWPATLYILSFSDFVRYDREGNVLLDSRTIQSKAALPPAMWSEPLPPHALQNVGSKELRIITVEVKIAINKQT